MKAHERVMCTLVNDNIEDIECIENRDVVDEMITEDSMPDRYKRNKDWKEICKKCQWHNY